MVGVRLESNISYCLLYCYIIICYFDVINVGVIGFYRIIDSWIMHSVLEQLNFK